MIYKTLLTVAILGLIFYSAAAQEQPPAIRAEIRMLAFSPDLQEAEAYAQDPTAGDSAVSVPTPIKTYLNHQFYTIQLKTQKIIFTTKSDRGSLTREGEIIGEATLPVGLESAIILVLPGKPGAKTHCQLITVNDSKRSFPAGSIHMSNLSPLPIRLMLEEKNFDFKPGGEILIEDPPVREGRMTAMHTFAFSNNVWMSVSTGLWPHPGRARSLKVLFQDPASGSIQMRAFDDDPPREPAPTPKPGT